MFALADRRRDVARGPAELWLESRQLPAGAHNRGEFHHLGGARQSACRSQSRRMRQQLPQRDPAQCAFGCRAAQALDLGPARLDDPAIGHSGRTPRLAGAAAEAEIDVAHLVLIEGHRLALPLGHEVDATPRRFRLETRDAEGRARVQAQAAVNARGKVVVAEKLEGFQTTNLPGFRMPCGSKAPLMRRISSRVAGGVPQAPSSRVRSGPAAIRTSDPPADSAAARALRTFCRSPSSVQYAIPMPGEAHHCEPAGRPESNPRNAFLGTAMRAQDSGARLECSPHIEASAGFHPSSETMRFTASGLPKKRASTRPSEKSSSAEGISGRSSARADASHASSIESFSVSTVTSWSGRGKTLKEAATIMPSEPIPPKCSFIRSYPLTFFTTRPPAVAR